jgi:DNA-binding transcriptional ArsR family regulator
MRHGPSIAQIAAAIGDPARANMLTALAGGAALTASELALEAGVAKQTASSHLARLSQAGLVAVEKQGRHHYYRLADAEVAQLLENLMGVAARNAPARVRPGPKEPALRRARVCYDHLAGDLGVGLLDGMIAAKWIKADDEALTPTKLGVEKLALFGVDVAELRGRKRPLCRACLDWSVRRNHLAGALGAAILERIYERGWARRRGRSRVVEFAPMGESALKRALPLSR